MKHELCPFFFQVGHYQLGAHNITYLQQSNARLWHLVQVPYNIMDWGTNKRVTTLIWLWSWDVRATNDYEVKNSCIHFFWVWCDIISPPPLRRGDVQKSNHFICGSRRSICPIRRFFLWATRSWDPIPTCDLNVWLKNGLITASQMYMHTRNMSMPGQIKTNHNVHHWSPQSNTNTYITLLKLHCPIHRIHILPW